MRRIDAAFILFAVAFLLFVVPPAPYNQLGWLPSLIALFLLYPYVYSFLETKLLGVKLHDYEEGEWKYIRKGREGYELLAALEVRTTSGTIESIDPMKFALVAKDLVETLGGAEPTLILYRGADAAHYYIVLREEGKELEDVADRLSSKAKNLRSVLLTYNLELHPVRPKVLMEVLGAEERNIGRKELFIAFLTLPLSLAALYYLFPLGLYLVSLSLPLARGAWRVWRRGEKRYRIGGGNKQKWWFAGEAHAVKYSRSEVYHYALRVANHISSRSSRGTCVIIRFSPASLKEQVRMERRTARKYLWATAFDWLGSTISSIREMQRLQRRFGDIPESLFKGFIVTNNELVKVDLDALGFTTFRAFSPYPALVTLFHNRSLVEKPGELLAYSLDFSFFTPLAIKRHLFRTGIRIGVGEDGEEIYIDLMALPNGHGIYVGSSGSGKSLFARHVALQAALGLGLKVVIIDPHGEYGEFARSLGGVEVEVKGGLDFSHYFQGGGLEYLVKGIEQIYGLGRAEVAVLRNVLEKSGSPSKAASKLPLTLNPLKPAFELMEGGVKVAELLDRYPIVSFNVRMDEKIAAVVAWMILGDVERYYEGRGIVHFPRCLVLVDEAHRIAAPLADRLVKLLKEVRKWGVGVILASQDVESFGPLFWRNISHCVALSPLPHASLRMLASRFQVTERDSLFIESASARNFWFPERGLLFITGWRFPVRVFLDVHPLALAENYGLLLEVAGVEGLEPGVLAKHLYRLDETGLEEYAEQNGLSEGEYRALAKIVKRLVEPPKSYVPI